MNNDIIIKKAKRKHVLLTLVCVLGIAAGVYGVYCWLFGSDFLGYWGDEIATFFASLLVVFVLWMIDILQVRKLIGKEPSAVCTVAVNQALPGANDGHGNPLIWLVFFRNGEVTSTASFAKKDGKWSKTSWTKIKEDVPSCFFDEDGCIAKRYADQLETSGASCLVSFDSSYDVYVR